VKEKVRTERGGNPPTSSKILSLTGGETVPRGGSCLSGEAVTLSSHAIKW